MKGGGRKKIDNPRVQVNVKVSQETYWKMKELREGGWKMGRWLDLEIGKL